MGYRTKTYIAAEWEGDSDAVEQLHKWNDGKKWSLSFTDAHEVTQARDSSLFCSIKSSLAKRLDLSKTFILIVGSNTKTVRAGSCQYCYEYNSYRKNCNRGYSIDYRSYLDYECDKAILASSEGKMKIVVLYNAASVNKAKCPDKIKYIGKHVSMCFIKEGKYYWDYETVKNAILE